MEHLCWGTPAECLRSGCLPALLAPWEGRSLTPAALGRQLGIPRRALDAGLESLERDGVVRLLPFHGGGRRTLLHLSPRCAVSLQPWASYCLDAVLGRLEAMIPGVECSWWMAGSTRRIDLVAVARGEPIGFAFAADPSPTPADWRGLEVGWFREVINRGFLLHPGTRAIAVGAIEVLPLAEFLQEPDAWVLGGRTLRPGVRPPIRWSYQRRRRRPAKKTAGPRGGRPHWLRDQGP